MVSLSALSRNSLFALSLLVQPFGSDAIAAAETPVSASEAIKAELPVVHVRTSATDLFIQIGDTTYEVGPQDTSENSQFRDLPELEKQAFLRNRALFLEATAKALQFMKYGIGIGSVAKDKVIFLAHKIRRIPTKDTSLGISPTLKERSNAIALGILRALDKKLFESAPIIARANEFGVVAAGGVEALGGVGTKGMGGLLDLGISLGYNRDTRSLVFQIFRDVESYHASPGAALGGIVSKAGFYASNQHDQVEDKGFSFYPPMFPGFQTTTQSSAMFGFSSGLTLPPSPIGDALTYTNRLDHARLLRLTISPMVLGFVRIQSSLPGSAVRDARMLVGSVARAALAVQEAAWRLAGRFKSAPLCRALLAAGT